MKQLAWIIGAVLMASCNTGNVRDDPRGITEFVLKSPVTISPGTARVKFQNGRAGRSASLLELACEVEVTDVRETPQTVQPDRFKTTRVMNRVVRDEQSGMPAMVPNVFSCNELYYESHWWLTSDKQPNVRKMICRQGFYNCNPGYYATRESMRYALGSRWEIL